jgi:hypothetical protein
MSSFLKPTDPSTTAFRWLTFFAIVESLQILMLLVLFANAFLGMNVQSAEEGFFDYFKHSVHPERELTYFRIFLILAFLIQAVGIWVVKKKAQEGGLLSSFRALALVDATWLLLQLFALFKIVLFDNPLWARVLLCLALAASVVSKVFLSELRRLVFPRFEKLLSQDIKRPWSWALDAAVVCALAVVIFIPDTDKALGQMLAFGQWIEWDHYLMGPVWASAKGLALNADYFSPLGKWLPALLGKLGRLTGGISYAGTLNAVMVLTTLYYVALYAFLRIWLKNIFLALAAVTIAVKLQLFSFSALPVIWQHPQLTPLRHLLDIGVLAALWAHQQSRRERWLWTASLLSGLAMAYMWDTGLYVTGALLVYVVCDAGGRLDFFRFRKALMISAVPLAVGVLVLLMGHGTGQLFLDGWSKGVGDLPIYDVLKGRQFFPFFVGFIIPLVYGATVLALMFRRSKGAGQNEDQWAMAVSAYGLLGYQNFAGRSEGSSYYLFAVPLVLIVCFWAKQILAQSSTTIKNTAGLAAAIVSIAGLLTGQAFLYYPGRLDLAGIDWTQQKKLMAEQLAVGADAQMIRRLTGPQDRVALLSSFETKILIEADRKPFFKCFPMVRSNYFAANSWGGLHLWARQQMSGLQQQLDEGAPVYIFIEKKIWNIPTMGPAVWQGTPSLMVILNYLQQRYQPVEQGDHLIVLRKKAS